MSLLGWIILIYFVSCLVVGGVILYIVLCLYEHQSELVERGFTRLDSAVFLTVSGFTNTGFTLTQDSLIGMTHFPLVYMWITVLVLLGNTALPIALRVCIVSLIKIEKYRTHYTTIIQTTNNTTHNYNSNSVIVTDSDVSKSVYNDTLNVLHHNSDPSHNNNININSQHGIEMHDIDLNSRKYNNIHTDNVSCSHTNNNKPDLNTEYLSNNNNSGSSSSSGQKYINTLQFILDHPQQLTTHLFSHQQSLVLAVSIVLLICVQYVFFLGSTLTRPVALARHDKLTLAGIGM